MMLTTRLFNTPARRLTPTNGGLTSGLTTRARFGGKTTPYEGDYMSTKLNDLQHGSGNKTTGGCPLSKTSFPVLKETLTLLFKPGTIQLLLGGENTLRTPVGAPREGAFVAWAYNFERAIGKDLTHLLSDDCNHGLTSQKSQEGFLERKDLAEELVAEMASDEDGANTTGAGFANIYQHVSSTGKQEQASASAGKSKQEHDGTMTMAQVEILKRFVSRALGMAVDSELRGMLMEHGDDIVGQWNALCSIFVRKDSNAGDCEKLIERIKTEVASGFKDGNVAATFVRLYSSLRTLRSLHGEALTERQVVAMVIERIPPWGQYLRHKWTLEQMPCLEDLKSSLIDFHSRQAPRDTTQQHQNKNTELTMTVLSGKSTEKRSCLVCGKTGHMLYDCWHAKSVLDEGKSLTFHESAPQWAREKGLGYFESQMKKRIEEKKRENDTTTPDSKQKVKKLAEKICALSIDEWAMLNASYMMKKKDENGPDRQNDEELADFFF